MSHSKLPGWYLSVSNLPKFLEWI